MLSLKQVGLVARCADERLRPMVQVATLTGIRQGELRALQVGDVDLRAGWLHVRRGFSAGKIGPTTGGYARRTPISPALADVLTPLVEGRRADDPLLRGPTGGPPSSTWILRSWNRAIEQAQQINAMIPYSDWHGLRRTWATTLATQGLALRLIQSWGGWSSLAVLERYLGLHAPQDAAERVSEALRMAA